MSLPISAVAGNSRLKSGPTTIRAKCGITNPTHPTLPATDIDDAVRSVEQMITKSLNRPVSTPKALASSSPNDNAFRCHLIKNRGAIPNMNGSMITRTSLLLTADRLPINQKVIAGNLAYGSATYLDSEVNDWNMVPTNMPANTNTSMTPSSLPTLHLWYRLAALP